MKFTMTVDMDGAAVQSAPGLELRWIAEDAVQGFIEQHRSPRDRLVFKRPAPCGGTLRDSAGNTCGRWEVA